MKNPEDKVIADIEGLKIETTFELLQNQDYKLWDDGSYLVNINDGRLYQAVELDPNGYYVETLLNRCKSGYSIEFNSNYRLSKIEQQQVHNYHEYDSIVFSNASNWTCYYDSDEKQTFDENLIKVIIEEENTDDDYGSPSGWSIERLDPSDFLKEMQFYWGSPCDK